MIRSMALNIGLILYIHRPIPGQHTLTLNSPIQLHK
jgi:hypothetical protein